MKTLPAWLSPMLLLVLAACALVLAARAFSGTAAQVRQIERRQADWQALRAQAAQRAAERAALAEATRAGGSPPLADWLRAQRPDWKTELREAERERISPDWSLQRMQVSMDRVNLDELGDTLAALAALPAPWRAIEITIEAGDGGPGRGRVSLLLEGLARAPAGGS